MGSNQISNGTFTGPVRSSLRSSASSSGHAGNVIVNTGGLSFAEGGGIEAVSFGAGRAGNITVVADQVTVEGAQAEGEFASGIFSETMAFENAGAAGNIDISSRRLDLQEGGLISTSTQGTGTGGKLTISATDSLTISGSNQFRVGELASTLGSRLRSSAFGSGAAGNITVEAGQLLLTEGGGIEAGTAGSGEGGDIEIVADVVKLNGVQAQNLFQTSINSETTPNPAFETAGRTGDIRINTRTLDIEAGAGISTATFSAGRGGNLSITATESTNIIGSNQIANSTFTGAVRSSLRSNANASGQSGNVTLNTGQLFIREGGGIEAVTLSTGRAGNIVVFADEINLEGTQSGSLIPSAITSEAAAVENAGNAGDIDIYGREINILDGAGISASTSGSSTGGQLTVTATESLVVSGISPILNGQTSASRLVTSTSGTGQAGDLQLTTNHFRVQDGGLVLASSFGNGNAGTVSISAENTELRGTALNNQIFSGIGSSSDAGTGNAGDVNLTGRSLLISDGAIINTTASAGGLGGNIELRLTGPLDATRGNISSAVSSYRGGDINISASALRFRDNSNIFTTSTTGNGGDIRIDAPGIVLLEDSDIFAFAPQGEGGNILFDTSALLTDTLFLPPAESTPTVEADEATTNLAANLAALDTNQRVDIDASGTVSGQVSETPDITFLENSIAEISSELISADAILSNSCISRSDRNNGIFVVTSNAHSQAPSNNAPAHYSTGTVGPILGSSAEVASRHADEISDITVEEPQAIYQLGDGRLVMNRDCES